MLWRVGLARLKTCPLSSYGLFLQLTPELSEPQSSRLGSEPTYQQRVMTKYTHM